VPFGPRTEEKRYFSQNFQKRLKKNQCKIFPTALAGIALRYLCTGDGRNDHSSAYDDAHVSPSARFQGNGNGKKWREQS
jgi:hypothetical protein